MRYTKKNEQQHVHENYYNIIGKVVHVLVSISCVDYGGVCMAHFVVIRCSQHPLVLLVIIHCNTLHVEIQIHILLLLPLCVS